MPFEISPASEAIAGHDHKIKKLLERCRKRSIKLNEQKVIFEQTEVPYIGHLLTSKGMKADPLKIDAVLNLQRSMNVSGVQRIMGTVNYLAKFLPGLSEVSEPLRLLTRTKQSLHGTKSMTEHLIGSRRW